MKEIRHLVLQELKLLPLMLMKLVGGTMTVAGTTVLVLVATRRLDWSGELLLLPVVTAAVGLGLFLLANWRLSKRAAAVGKEPLPKPAKRLSFMSWLFFLLLAVGFLLLTQLLTG